MKAYIRGSREKYPELEGTLTRLGFVPDATLSREGEPVYHKDSRFIYLRRGLVVLEMGDVGEGYIKTGNDWLLNENSGGFGLVKVVAEILAPVEFLGASDSVRVRVPDSLRRFEKSAEH